MHINEFHFETQKPNEFNRWPFFSNQGSGPDPSLEFEGLSEFWLGLVGPGSRELADRIILA